LGLAFRDADRLDGALPHARVAHAAALVDGRDVGLFGHGWTFGLNWSAVIYYRFNAAAEPLFMILLPSSRRPSAYDNYFRFGPTAEHAFRYFKSRSAANRKR
jgi:hypothetical protein